MAHDSHADTSDHAPGVHPPLPPVTDEAPDSPMSLPLAGLGLLLLAILYVALHSAMAPEEPVVEEAAAAEEAPAEAAPAEAAPAAAPAH